MLEDFDANGLYASVMSDESITFPAIESMHVLKSEHLSFNEVNTYPHFIIECDIDMPKVAFIPLAVKLPKTTGCRYQTGKSYNQIFNDIDIKEGLKIGMKILKIH